MSATIIVDEHGEPTGFQSDSNEIWKAPAFNWSLTARPTQLADRSAEVRVQHLTRRATYLSLRFIDRHGHQRDDTVQLTREQARELAAELLAGDSPGQPPAGPH